MTIHIPCLAVVSRLWLVKIHCTGRWNESEQKFRVPSTTVRAKSAVASRSLGTVPRKYAAALVFESAANAVMNPVLSEFNLPVRAKAFTPACKLWLAGGKATGRWTSRSSSTSGANSRSCSSVIELTAALSPILARKPSAFSRIRAISRRRFSEWLRHQL